MAEKTNPYLERLRDNLRRYGGTGDFTKYTYKMDSRNGAYWGLVCKLYPHYLTLPIIENGHGFDADATYHTCLCGKENIIHVKLVQMRSNTHAPLLVVGSCCVEHFMEKTSQTHLECTTCHKPYKSTKYAECKDCRMRRDGKVCTFCGDPTARKTKICSECQSLNNDYERAAAFYRRKVAKRVFETWKEQTRFVVECRMCSTNTKHWKARKQDNKCWTCFCLHPFD